MPHHTVFTMIDQLVDLDCKDDKFISFFAKLVLPDDADFPSNSLTY